MDDLKLLKALKNKILALAMQGKLVEQNENDEPASILLEKIKNKKSELLKQGKLKKEKELPPIKADEVLYELPKSWQWVRLGEIGDTQTGTTPSISKEIYLGNYIPFVKPADIQNSELIFSDYLSNEGLKYGRLIKKNSILMVCIGGSIGKCCYTNVDVSCNQQINTFSYYFKPFKFYFYCLQSEYFQTQIQMKSLGVATPIINKTLWENIIVPLPPLAEQERIVAKIEEIFAIIDEIEKNITENKKLSKVLYNKLLSLAMQGKLVKQDENDEPASILLEKIKNEKAELLKQGKLKKEKESSPISADEVPYELPKSWKWVRLGEVCELINGDRSNKYPSDKDIKQVGIPFISAKYIVNNMICLDMIQSFITAEKFQILNNGKLQHRDLVFVLRGSVGKHGIFYISNKYNTGFINAQLIILRPICVNEKYINLLFDTKYFTELLEDKSTGSTVKQMSDNVLSKILIPLPPLAEQERIVAKIEEIKEIIDEIRLI